jgi:energy-coupling factor transporter ATP-binding protein EcfA2
LIIRELYISNLLSFKESKVSFGKYNVVTGPNGAGKTNIVRILQLIMSSPDYAFSTIYLEDEIRFNQKSTSSIKINIRLSDQEAVLISKLLFRNSEVISMTSYEVKFYLLWDGPRWGKQNIKCAFILENGLLIWRDNSTEGKIGFIEDSEIGPEDLFMELGNVETVSTEQIQKIRQEKEFEPDFVLQDKLFQDLLFSKQAQAKDYFSVDGRSIFYYYKQDEKISYDDDIYQYCGVRRPKFGKLVD